MLTTASLPSIRDMATIAPSQLPRLGQLPERFTVEVTRLDIAYGIRESGNHCPIACAVRRAFEMLGVKITTLDVDDTNCDVLLPTAAFDAPWIAYRHDARVLVRMFDSGERVQPRDVTLWRVAA